MKIIFLLILIPLNVLADNYIYYLDKNIYNSSIKVVDDNTPSCGSAGGVPVATNENYSWSIFVR